MVEIEGAPLHGMARPAAGRGSLAERRVIAYAGGLAALGAIVLVVSALRGLWFVDAGGAMPLDFLAFWGAGRLTLEGAAVLAYDAARLKLAQEQGIGQSFRGIFPWFYPPFFLLAAAPFALLPYLTAFFLWFAATLAAYLAAIRAILPRPSALVAALGLPAVLWNALTGQNGLLSAALLGGGLALLGSRPILAGALLGLLSYKPQLALLVPVALLVGREARALCAAVATAVLVSALATLLFGVESWTAFLSAEGDATRGILTGDGLGIHKIQSVYAALRMAGAGDGLAWIGHGLVAAAVTALVIAIWRRPVSGNLKAAALAAGAALVTPYVLIYDLAVLAVAIAFLAREGLARGFRVGEAPVLVAAFLLPLVYVLMPSPVGLAADAALLALVFRRFRTDPPLAP